MQRLGPVSLGEGGDTSLHAQQSNQHPARTTSFDGGNSYTGEMGSEILEGVGGGDTDKTIHERPQPEYFKYATFEQNQGLGTDIYAAVTEVRVGVNESDSD